MEWNSVERPGYFGKLRDELAARWDREHGAGNWRIAYEWGGRVVDRAFGIQIYEDAYAAFLDTNPDSAERLVSSASDVYDTAPSNVEAGLSYDHQETPASHIHDVAIRRALLRTGRWFRGDHLVHVRWVGSEGFWLNPGVVPFHRPGLICTEEVRSYSGKPPWWRPGTIEDFYQRNKLLQIRAS